MGFKTLYPFKLVSMFRLCRLTWCYAGVTGKRSRTNIPIYTHNTFRILAVNTPAKIQNSDTWSIAQVGGAQILYDGMGIPHRKQGFPLHVPRNSCLTEENRAAIYRGHLRLRTKFWMGTWRLLLISCSSSCFMPHQTTCDFWIWIYIF